MQEFILHIRGGEISNKSKVRSVFTDLKDGKYLIKIQSIKKRSLLQNAYWWGCLLPMVKEGLVNAGYDEIKSNEDCHEVLKALFLKENVVSKKDGNVIEVTGSTTKLTTTQFNELIDCVIKWAAEYLSIQVPYPNEPLIMFAEYDQNNKVTIID
jgi:hypothetical protein